MPDGRMLNSSVADKPAPSLAVLRDPARTGIDGDLPVRAFQHDGPYQPRRASARDMAASVRHVAMQDGQVAGLLERPGAAASGALARADGDTAVVAGQLDRAGPAHGARSFQRASVLHGIVRHQRNARVSPAADGDVARRALEDESLDAANALVRPIDHPVRWVKRNADGHHHAGTLHEDLTLFTVQARPEDPALVAARVTLIFVVCEVEPPGRDIHRDAVRLGCRPAHVHCLLALTIEPGSLDLARANVSPIDLIRLHVQCHIHRRGQAARDDCLLARAVQTCAPETLTQAICPDDQICRTIHGQAPRVQGTRHRLHARAVEVRTLHPAAKGSPIDPACFGVHRDIIGRVLWAAHD
mmetsp:Transcript_96407/g.311304  ORF Transcript_96407/g.311304 Transcript_96407/m.311304 type:complete len:357 (-) Transcript_96407:268-1338(-)